jgi:hypothetical protein
MSITNPARSKLGLSIANQRLNACRLLVLTLILYLTAIECAHSAASYQALPDSVTAKSYQFVNGQWFDGKSFRRATFYSVSGILTHHKPRKVDEVVDLDNGFVIPPFGEAHNHNIEKSYNLEAQIQRYLNDGIFYIKIPNSIRRFSLEIKDKINLPESVDVVFGTGGLTATGGHPIKLYEEVLSKSAYKGVQKGWLENKAYFIIDGEGDLDNKWGAILATRPDFIKTFLLYSEEFDKRRDDPAYYGRKGLDPKLLRLIVDKAHKANLRVVTHIETATDFHNALIAGVDEINHLPGYNIPTSQQVSSYAISEQDAQLAARKDVVVVTTTILSKLREKDPTRLKLIEENQIRNLHLLRKHGVKIAIGSDSYDLTSLAEATHLHEMEVFDNLTLLKLWCETTPQAIFPSRKIGHLNQGSEASFLVLTGDPIENFENVKRIKLRVKQGRIIKLASH